MNSAYAIAIIGAATGLVTGTGTALTALRAARSQVTSAADLQRRQWTADNLRDCYNQLAGAQRRLMLAWWTWWGNESTDRRTTLAEIVQAFAAFETACAVVRLYAPYNVVRKVNILRKSTIKFDAYAYDTRLTGQDAEYKRRRSRAEAAMPAFIMAARCSIDQALSSGTIDPSGRDTGAHAWPVRRAWSRRMPRSHRSRSSARRRS